MSGPWGGGSKVLHAIVKRAEAAGHRVTFDTPSGCDVILCVDPRRGDGPGFTELREFNVPLVQRVGDLGTHGKPGLTHLLSNCLPRADAVIFPSVYARHYAVSCMGFSGQSHVITNGPQASFYGGRLTGAQPHSPPRLVTHHWSDNTMKGFDTYRELQAIASQRGFEFTYIGRASAGVVSAGIMDSNQLADELPRHDVYVTASEAEAGANHVLEAMACGLPVVCLSCGGSIPEYVGPRGTVVDVPPNPYLQAKGIVGAASSILSAYDHFKCQVTQYCRTADDVADEYVRVLEAVT